MFIIAATLAAYWPALHGDFVFDDCYWTTDVEKLLRALELAHEASRVSGGRYPKVLFILAAAYAESGRYGEADETAERALSLTNVQGESTLAEAIQKARRLYQSGQPLRDVHVENPAAQQP